MARRAYWEDFVSIGTVAAGANSTIAILPTLDVTATRGVTVARLIVNMWFKPVTTGAAQGAQQISMGIGVVAQEAAAAGVVPDPNVAADRPARGWLFRSVDPVQDSAGDANPMTLVKGDFRGKRKLDNGELLMIIDNDDLDGTSFTVRHCGLIRTLYLLD